MGSGSQGEVKELEKLKKHVMRDITAQNFVSWQVQLRGPKNTTSLFAWKEGTTNTISIASTNLVESRLTNTSRVIIRGMIGFFVNMFDHDKVPSHIALDEVYLRSKKFIWVANVIAMTLNPQLLAASIENLKDLIRAFVNVDQTSFPKDLQHLFGCLDEFKTDISMKQVVLMHPCLYSNSTLICFVDYMCQVYKFHRSFSQNPTCEQLFRGIASQIPLGANHLKHRMKVDAFKSDWYGCYNTTKRRISTQDKADFKTDIGPLIFMRHAALHYKDVATTISQPFSIESVEDELYVLFPLYIPHFVKIMVQNNYLKVYWRS